MTGLYLPVTQSLVSDKNPINQKHDFNYGMIFKQMGLFNGLCVSAPLLKCFCDEYYLLTLVITFSCTIKSSEFK